MSGDESLRDAWLQEMWACVHEPDHEWRRREREARRLLAEQEERRAVESRREAL